jgi:L-2-hydroxycarboxylate dehydrogenase (NAD+)
MPQTISIEEFSNLCQRVFTRQGFTAEEVEACTDEVVDTQCRGMNSHGAALIPLYLEFKREGTVGPIELLKETPLSAHLEGNNNAGPIVSRRAMDIAIEMAQTNGIGIVGARNRSPFILAGYYPRKAAEQGLIGINFGPGGYIDIPAYGGMDLIMSTNPTGVAVPSKDGPVVLDMAFSSLGAGGWGSKRNRLEGLPWFKDGILSKEGVPTTDINEALQGILTCFGGHKGAGLSLMLDLIIRPLVGGKIDNADPRIRSMLFIALRTDLFVSEEQFLDDVSQLVSNVRNSKPRPGVKQVALPGDSGEKFFAECRQYGIPIVEALVIDKTGVGIERKIYDQLVELAAS